MVSFGMQGKMEARHFLIATNSKETKSLRRCRRPRVISSRISIHQTLQVHDVWYSFLVQKLTYSFGAKFEWRALELAPKSNWSIREPVLVRQVIGTLVSSLPVFGMNDAIVLMN